MPLQPVDLSTTVGTLHFANPVLVASGTFGYIAEAEPFVDVRRLAGLIPKTVTVTPRKGNPPPRIVETAAGMLNAIGLDNDGIDHFIEHHLPYLRTLGVPVIPNVAGKSVDEFAYLVNRLAAHAGMTAIELNLSCPNVSGGTDFAVQPRLAEQVLAACRKETGLPLWAKLTPNTAHVAEVAAATVAGGANAVTLINTVLGMAIDWRRRRPLLAATFGGLSGPAIKPIALRVVCQVARAVQVPIIGVGGITCADDVLEFLVAGASAVEIGTGHFAFPRLAMEILDELPRLLHEAGIARLRDLIGSLER